jgi:hypothetical protein
VLPPHDTLSNEELHDRLNQTLQRLYDRNILLDFSDHLSDRQLYCLIARDILPECEKAVSIPNTFLHWQCIDPVVDEENWLRYYADEVERRQWQEQTGLRLPPMESPPFPRSYPRRKLR